MRITITGSSGQLGTALQTTLSSHDLLLLDLPSDDITDLEGTVNRISKFNPDVIIHAAAYINVDGCEKNPELAYKVNALGTRNIAVASQACEAAVVYISTDYVFDGTKESPYWEFDEPNPLSVYARSKLAGERIIQTLTNRFYIARPAWLYSKTGNNFVKTILRLAEERDELNIVTDEIGSPTYAPDLAAALTSLIELPAYGIYHFTNTGTCSRYQFAQKILELAGKADFPLKPSTNYQRAATVPSHVELRNFCGETLGITMRPWDAALEDFFK